MIDVNEKIKLYVIFTHYNKQLDGPLYDIAYTCTAKQPRFELGNNKHYHPLVILVIRYPG